MSTTTEYEVPSAFTVSLKTGSLDRKLEQEDGQLATVLHELFIRTEALRTFDNVEIRERQPHQYRAALYFAAVARSKARDTLRDLGYSV
ncbi:MAG: hypothetical protein ACJ8G3_03375 [Burkholderiaceae bacterium]